MNIIIAFFIYMISLCLSMDLTNRQLSIVNIVMSQDKVTASKIRTLLPEPISIPILNSEIDKLIYYKVLAKIGRGKSKAYVISPNYK
ncbi:MAG: hypothetical protein V3U92_02470 [Cellulophaga sp.]